ncbi:MAG: hypothetical protein IJ814_01515 [Paludibacteraceae bacterium]|nr:hypothetical protein [Paludibacteraceae bacterium]
MKKIFTLVLCTLSLCHFSSLSAAEKVVWTGTQVLGEAGEDALTIEADQLTDLALHDTLAVTVTDMTDTYCQLNIAGKNPWTVIPGTEWNSLTEVGTYKYEIGTEALLASITSGGLMIQGKLCTLTQISILPYESSQEPEPEPEPEPEIEDIKVVWSGDTAISWDETSYAGVQLETAKAGISFEGLKKDYYLFFYVASVEADAQYELCKGDWTSLVGAPVAQTDTMFVYQVTDEALVADIIANGLIIKGIRFHLTSIVISVNGPKKDDPEPQPEAKEYDFKTVWTGDVAISWNQDVYKGTELVTIDVQADMFAGLLEGDSIKCYYAEAIEGAQFALSYRTEDWGYADLTVSEHEGFFAYRVASDEIAMDIADRGLVIRGQGYHLTKIELGTPKQTEGIETPSLQGRSGEAYKLLRNGQLLILRNGITYTLNGQILDR